jgi:hypothetical protein
MTRIALLTALAMATSTVAAAQPPVRVEARVEARDDAPIVYQRDRDHYDRYDDSHWSREIHSRWTPLGRGFNARTERQSIPLNGSRFHKLRLEGVRGQPLVTKVVIEFGNRSSQTVDLNSTLSGGAGEVIDLNGGTRRVNRIIVFTDPQARGTYAVYGS